MATPILFFIGYIGACALGIFRHPVFGIVAYFAAFYLHPPSRWWGESLPNVRWSLVAAAATAIGILLHSNRGTKAGVMNQPFMLGLIIFIFWLMIQSIWALDSPMHQELITYYIKYAIAVVLIYKAIDSEGALRIALWAHVLGCFYFGFSAFVSYTGGRYENFGGPGFADANFAAIQTVTGIFAAVALLLAGKWVERLVVVLVLPFIVNGLVTTISRSGFLALLTGGVMFLYFAPARYKPMIASLGAVGLVLLLSLAHDQYWERIETILFAGEKVEGVDTGSARIVLWQAQGKMFGEHPLGCGHRCTAILSPRYLDDRYLTGPKDNRARSSHNTFLTLLVEQGIVGGAFYLLFLCWAFFALRNLKKQSHGRDDTLFMYLPAFAAALFAIATAELFVDYLKLEVRFWMVGFVMVAMKLQQQSSSRVDASPKDQEDRKRPITRRELSGRRGQLSQRGISRQRGRVS